MNKHSFVEFLIHPQRVITDYHRQARSLSDSLDVTQQEDGPSDAFRHCFTSAAVARDYGPELADVAGTVHEVKAVLASIGSDREEPSERTRMDYWNNAIGRFIAKEALAKTEPAAKADERLAEQCKRALDKEVLIQSIDDDREGRVIEREMERLRAPDAPDGGRPSAAGGPQESRNESSESNAPREAFFEQLERVLERERRIDFPATLTYIGESAA